MTYKKKSIPKETEGNKVAAEKKQRSPRRASSKPKQTRGGKPAPPKAEKAIDSGEDKVQKNHAYIDGQNLHSGVAADGWKLDHRKFRNYLRDEHNVEKAYIFLGFMEEQQMLYSSLQEAGFILIFKPLLRYEDGSVKGNVDADLVLQVMIDLEYYDKAVIVSGDGDFAGLLRHLSNVGKLAHVVLPNKHTYSSLFERLNDFDDKHFSFIGDLKGKLAYRVRPKQRSSVNIRRRQT